MKRLIILVLILSILIGCSTQNIVNETQTNDNSSNNVDIESNDNSDSQKDSKDETSNVGNKNSLDNDVVAEVFSKSLYPGKGENVEIQFKASNKGLYDVEGFDYRIEISKKGNIIYEYKNKTESINKNQKVTIKTLNYKFDALGNYKVELFLDELNTIKELEEENNIDSITIYVKDQTTSSSTNNDDTTISEVEGCTDSDGGKKYNKLGTCKDENFVKGKSDFCAGDENLAEMFCSPTGLCDIEIRECDGVCRDGICIE